MKKSQLINRFRANKTPHGYSLEYADSKEWVFYTPHAYHYDDISFKEDLTIRELRLYIRLIKSQNRYKVF